MEWWEECSCTQRCPWTASSRAPTMRWTGCSSMWSRAHDDEVIKTTGAMLGAGAATTWARQTQAKKAAPYGGAWTGPVFVLTP